MKPENTNLLALEVKDARIKELEEALREANVLLNDSPNYHAQGMGCGLEDKGITDRYEAAEYGWNECLERYFVEILKPSLEIIQDALGKDHS